MNDYTKHYEKKGRKLLEKYEEQVLFLTESILNDLEEDNDGNLSWPEFKGFMENCMYKKEAFIKFLTLIE